MSNDSPGLSRAVSPTISVGIVDDHPIIRAGLLDCLSSQNDISVAGLAENAADALSLCRAHRPDVMILDIDLPGRSGLDLLPVLHRISPDVAVLIFTGYPMEQYALKLLKLGAKGFLSKACEPGELIQAVRSLGAGNRHLTSDIADLLALSLDISAETPHKLLTDRELQVFLKLARGLRTSVVAEYLALSEKSVMVYRSRIKKKLELKSSGEFTYYVLKHQLLH